MKGGNGDRGTHSKP